MNSTNTSIDRIRRARKSGSEMMADLERAPWTMYGPHHTVTTPYAPGSTDVDDESSMAPHVSAAKEAELKLIADGSSAMDQGGESVYQQHAYLEGLKNKDLENNWDMWRPSDVTGQSRIDWDDHARRQTGLSQQDWEGYGLGMSNQDRIRAMSEQQVAADKAKFDQNAAIEARRNVIREQSDKDFAEWEAGKQGRMDDAAKEQEAFHSERRAKKAQQDAAASDAALDTRLTSESTPAPNFTFDPVAADAKQAEAGIDKELKGLLEQEIADSSEMDALPVESTPMEAPLPGEETLPPAVAAWSQRRAERGMGGLKTLRERYYKEVPEDARSGGMHGFEDWLTRQGMKDGMPTQEAMSLLNRLSPMDAGHAERRRDQYVNTMMKRHAEYLAKNGITRQQIYDAYDSGVASDKAGDPIMSGSRAANRTIMNNMRDQRDQQIAINVRKHFDQQSRSRSFGVPIGAVQFFDSLQAAKTPQERANILMLAHRSQPHMGWDKMGAMLMKGEIDNDALSQWAGRFGSPQEQPKPMDRIAENATAITDNFGNPGWEDQARSHSNSVRGQGAKPPEIEADIKQFAVNGTRKILLAGGSLTPEQKVAAQKSFDGSSIASFANQMGLKPDDERLPQMYYAIFDKAPPLSWFGAPGRLLASGGNAISDGVRAMIGSFGQPVPPAAWAGAPDSSLKGPNPFN
jgi:hypothetical protein